MKNILALMLFASTLYIPHCSGKTYSSGTVISNELVSESAPIDLPKNYTTKQTIPMHVFNDTRQTIYVQSISVDRATVSIPNAQGGGLKPATYRYKVSIICYKIDPSHNFDATITVGRFGTYGNYLMVSRDDAAITAMNDHNDILVRTGRSKDEPLVNRFISFEELKQCPYIKILNENTYEISTQKSFNQKSREFITSLRKGVTNQANNVFNAVNNFFKK